MLIENSSELKIGEHVVAIGNPFGLSGTMRGKANGLGRMIPSLESVVSPIELLLIPPDEQPSTPSPSPLPPSVPDRQLHLHGEVVHFLFLIQFRLMRELIQVIPGAIVGSNKQSSRNEYCDSLNYRSLFWN